MKKDICNTIGKTFNPEDHILVTAGWYNVVIEKAKVKRLKQIDGYVLSLYFRIIGTQFNGRNLFTDIILYSPNCEATIIGQRELSSMLTACKMKVVSDTTELIGKTLDIRVIEKEVKNTEFLNAMGGPLIKLFFSNKIPSDYRINKVVGFRPAELKRCPYCNSLSTIKTADKVDLTEGFRDTMNESNEQPFPSIRERYKKLARTKVNGLLALIAELFKDGGEENIKIENGKRILRCSFHIDLTDNDLTSEDIGNAFEECIETK